MKTHKRLSKVVNKITIPSVLVLLISSLPQVYAEGVAVYSVHDIDRDGYLDRAEFEIFAETRRQRSGGSDEWVFDAVDSDGDNKISEQEMVNALIANVKNRGNR